MKKIVLNMDDNKNVYNKDQVMIGTLIGDYEEYVDNTIATITLQLVKQGVTVDEIIKLKNADLI